MKHIIIGGHGFVGTYLVRELQHRGEEVLICDINKNTTGTSQKAKFITLDITKRTHFQDLPLNSHDIVYNLAARLLHPIIPRGKRREYFWPVNYTGVANLLDYMIERGCSKLVCFTTDMVYGHMKEKPRREDHSREPLGPYGASKKAAEDLCASYRAKGVDITIFRPRLIIGPGRLGILENLFWLIDHNLPVPIIGNGSNHYQFISVFDCVDAAICAAEKGVPNAEYNLGSNDPPTVAELLGYLIKGAGKRSVLLKTPAGAVKRVLAFLDVLGLPLLDPEQYLIADEDCVLDISKAEAELGWRPRFGDQDMLLDAYSEYKKNKSRTERVVS